LTQAELVRIFSRLRKILKTYENTLVTKFDLEGKYDLWSMKPVVIEGRKKKELFFAGLIIQKDYVGFYFMPAYADSEIKRLFRPELLKLLKGKSCFHIKALDAALESQIREALKAGYRLYRRRGWV
jgi:hypothetical protein